MAGERNFLRIPPDSTGKRVRLEHGFQLFFNQKLTNDDPSHIWVVGDNYTIPSVGVIVINSVHVINSDTGMLDIELSDQAMNDNLTPAVGENIIDSLTGDTIAKVSEVRDIYTNDNVIVGHNNPDYGLSINKFGSAQVTFEDGPAELTTFGKLKVNDSQVLAVYDFTRDSMPRQFVNSREGEGSTAEWDSSTRSVKLSISSVSGSRTTHTSNLFHTCVLGSGTLFILATRIGDAGKTNCTRSWGAFDSTDGIFFSLDGTTLRASHRWTIGGAMQQMNVPQSLWNRDTLDGSSDTSNPSGLLLDITKINLYWVDYQHIGGGRSRWGLFLNGQRVVCHEMNSSNGEMNLNNLLGNPNRPMCWAQTNSGTTSGTSEIYAYGGAVHLETINNPTDLVSAYSANISYKMWGTPQTMPYWKTGQSRNGSTSVASALAASYTSSTANQYIGSLSVSQFYRDSTGAYGTIENHSVYQPKSLSLSANTISTNAAAQCELRLFAKCIMRNPQWAFQSDHHTVDLDQRGDHLAHGAEIGRFRVNGTGTQDFTEIFKSYQYGSVRNVSDQPFGRVSQLLTAFNSHSDKYSVGHTAVKVTVGRNPFYGSSIHLFEDTQPVIFKTSTGGNDISGVVGANTMKTTDPTGYASADRVTNPAGWYYLSYVDSNEAWLYNSQADIADDRTVRILNVDNITNVNIGDTITVNGSITALVAYAETGKIYVVNRQMAFTDVLTSGTWTTPSGSGTFTNVTLHTGWQKDYWTCHKALNATDLGIGTVNLSNATDVGIELYGNTPPRQAWTMMVRWLSSTTADADGDAGPVQTNAATNLTIYWSEITQ